MARDRSSFRVLVGGAYGIASPIFRTGGMFNHLAGELRMGLTEPVTNEALLMLTEDVHSIFELNYCVGDLPHADKVLGEVFKSIHIMFLSYFVHVYIKEPPRILTTPGGFFV